MTRIAEYGSAAWRRWKHDHHWASSGASADPLGAGNSALITALGGNSAVLAFYDVRKNVTATTTVSAWDDVRGSVGFGPTISAVVAPSWDSTNLLISNTSSNMVMRSAASSVFDMTTNGGLTLVAVGSIAMTAANYCFGIADSNSAVRLMAILNSATTSGKIEGKFDGGGTINPAPTVASDGTRRVMFLTSKSGSNRRAIAIPNAAIVNTLAATPAAGSNVLTLFGYFNAGGNTGCSVRAILVLPGDTGIGLGTSYTAPMNTITTWAQTYHAAVAA